ncbi:MAG: hypothetical protein GY861_01400 [bacterium]|nr:hypothetical protein [bacterium]
MKKKTHTELTILDNSYNFINESIIYYRKAKRDPKYWSFAVFLIIQGIELLLKQVLKSEHPILIFENIDKPKHTVSISQALDRLISISNIELDDKEVRLIKKAIVYRNLILHYEISFNNKEFKNIYSQLFEFVHYFHRRHLNKDLHEVVLKKLWNTEAELMNYFKRETVFYHGVEVAKSTPAEILEYQKLDGILLGDKYYRRIKYGDEDFKWSGNPCHDCGCLKGQYHLDDCDVEECPICSGQFLACVCSLNNELLYYVSLEANNLIENES